MMTKEQEKAMDCSRSLCVTAGAGAGKTYTLVEKYIYLIKSGVAVSEILAVTFTEKAAAEMKHRVREAILKLEGAQWDNVKDDINWCKISTFHAFCADVLKEFPLETGVSPGFYVLEEVEQSELLGEVMDQLLSPPIEKDLENALVRLLTDIPRYRFTESVAYMYDRRSEISPFLSSFNTKEELLKIWHELAAKSSEEEVNRFLNDPPFKEALKELRTLASRYGSEKDTGCKYLLAIASFLEEIKASNGTERVRQAITSLQAVKGKRGAGSEKNFGADLGRFRAAYDGLQEAFERLGTSTMENDSLELSERAASLMVDLKVVFNEFQRLAREMKRERNAIDFEDMIAIVHDLFVRDPTVVQEEFTNRFRYILVDEFQDTDAIQSDIIWRMAGEEKAAERPFIVGDPKQSIYLFRNVDVSMFKTFQEKIIDLLEGNSIHLDTNFRSSPQIIAFVNHVFGQLMKEAREKWEFPYQAMQVSESRKKDQGSVELLYLPNAEGSEAEFVARRIQEIVQKGSRRVFWSPDGQEHIDGPRNAGYGDIAILLRAKTHLHEFEEALDLYGIPYRVHAGLGFFERQEITDLRNLIAFLNNKEDDLALYGVLRSPYFAISDEQLFLVALNGHGSLWKKLGAYVANVENSQLRAAVLTLESWLRYANRLTVPRLLSKVFEESGIFAVYGGLPDGGMKIANLEKMLSMARGAQSSGFLTLGDFLRWLQLSMDGGAIEGLAQLAGGEDSVKIMTIHAAKGLEFPIVIVPEMNFHRREDSSTLVFSEHLGFGIDAPDVHNGHDLKATLPKKLIEAERARKESAEKKRLLYVALTRAKDHLVMCGHAPTEREQEKELWINWLIEATDLGPSDVTEGYKQLMPDLRMEIRSDPSSIHAEAVEKGGKSRHAATEVAPFVIGGVPLSFTPSTPTLSPSSASLKSGGNGDLSITERSPPPEIACLEDQECDAQPAVRGTIIHEILTGKEPSSVLSKYGIKDPAKAEQYARYYERFKNGPLLKGANAAYNELAFFAKIEGNFYKGRIDLLIHEEDGSWHVVDHKTGSFDGEIGKKKMIDYSVQMSIYQAATESLMKKKVKSSHYLVDENRVIQMVDKDG